MDTSFETVVCGLGMNVTGYTGAFTPTLNRIINEVLNGFDEPGLRVLHLFSGVSKIGDVRVDIERPEATHRADVLTFLQRNKEHWRIVILDPPYNISRKSKLAVYGKTSSVAADVILRRTLARWFLDHADNVLWLDMCAPLFEGFRRRKLWFLFPGGYHTVRILSWLTKE